jgi:hypothetical protein
MGLDDEPGSAVPGRSGRFASGSYAPVRALRLVGDEQALGVHVAWASPFGVPPEAPAQRRGHGHPPLLAPLPHHPQAPALAVLLDVVDPEAQQLAEAEAGVGQGPHHERVGAAFARLTP